MQILNSSYLTDSYIGFTLKMESVTKNTIFGLKMMVKSGLEKFILYSHLFNKRGAWNKRGGGAKVAKSLIQ